jgi:hypothetical protein
VVHRAERAGGHLECGHAEPLGHCGRCGVALVDFGLHGVAAADIAAVIERHRNEN